MSPHDLEHTRQHQRVAFVPGALGQLRMVGFSPPRPVHPSVG
ncbi:hypothetical protein [Metapseudomonas otitidis]|nr:hypothetical protein [Pseudomonas otitidis]MDH0338390.1 hypothetical protein [Pseudomonas otitidis]